MRSLAIAVMLVFASVNAGAAVVDYGRFNYDAAQSLDWLDLSETAGMSLTDALAANAGWRLATRDEVEILFDQLFPDYVANNQGGYDIAGYINSTNYPNPYPQLLDEADSFQSLFGSWERTGVADTTYSLGYFQDGTRIFRFGVTNEQLSGGDRETFVYGPAQKIGAYSDLTSLASGGSDIYGTYLVRSTVVPVPAAVWLLASALGLLSCQRRIASPKTQ